ncbi:MAG: lipopolysaccharide biosynthesis protein [Bacteroides sp.]|nr:lipopolysaccharide biosynthesis protein [Bacteroides sp.]
MGAELNNKIVKATKWSTITEIVGKLVAPISTMVLARILTPEAYGVLVTATMVISFAELFTDAGFQKYIIQHEFDDEQSLYRSTNVAFISNLVLSLSIWLLICIFSPQIAETVGNKGYGNVIAIASVCIPLAAFSSIQMALYKRHLDFKTLFIVRIVGLCIPLLITIPAAIILRSYWALIIGMIASNLSNAIILTIKSKWKPKIWYNWDLFKEMFAFTGWTMMESIILWATSYVDIFIIGRMLNGYYLGLYRTSMNTVGQFTTLIIAAIVPILFSAISRLQNDPKEFNRVFLKFQKIISILIVPLGVILYLYRNLLTEILLGPKWHEASLFIGLWALTTALALVLANISGEVYRAKGKPKISVIVQLTHIACIIPTVIIAIGYGYETLCIWRSLIRLQLIAANMVALYYLVKISPIRQIKNIGPALIAGAVLIGLSYIMPISSNYWIAAGQLIISAIIYLGIIICFPKERKDIKYIKSNLLHR